MTKPKISLKRPFQISILIASIVLIYLIGIIITAELTYFSPDKTEKIAEFELPDTLSIQNSYACLIWNIGYAGLGKNMDFFYEGGSSVRDSRENVLSNLSNINKQLLSMKDSIDFGFFQEVDIYARRSYFINQADKLCENINECIKTCAINYNVNYIPVPLFNPMGRVKSGLISLSKLTPHVAYRHGFNKNYGFPKKLFMLNRCFLESRYHLYTNKELVLLNIHNSAYDDGGLRKDQLKVIKEYITNEYKNGNYVVVAGDWNMLPPNHNQIYVGYKSDTNSKAIDTNYISKRWQFVFENNVPTNRYLRTALNNNTPTQLIDFYLVSPNIIIESYKTIDLNFENSDHNPVYFKFSLETIQK